ncbi:MAG: uroporphyrinogen-III synthase [Acidimicrobiales bacterium]|nr:uroporphyrinogen-III synthase [Acidimicrobiales bacterium]
MASAVLDGFVVGITADRRADEQKELLRRHGARSVHGPTMRTLPIIADGDLRKATDALIATPPDVVFANTGIGMRAWLSAADSWGLGEELADVLRGAEVVARGPKAAGSLVTIGCDVSWRGPTGRLAEVIDHLRERDLNGVRIVCQRDGSTIDQAATALGASGADVVEVATYKWERPEDETAAGRLIDACLEGTVDAVTFTSRPALENLFALAAERGQAAELLDACTKSIVPVCVGPVCHEAAVAHGMPNAIVPVRPMLGAMVNALVDALGQRRVVLRLPTLELALAGTVATVNGVRVELTSREAAVLAVLADRPGAVVAKPTLLKAVWGDASADPHALEMVVSRLRRQLGPGGKALRTVVRRGYMLGG